MSHTIRVLASIRPNNHESFSDAVDIDVEKTGLDKPKCDLINGRKVVNYQFNGTSLKISFENEMHLIVSLGENLINWDIVTIEPKIENQIIEQKIYFDYGNGNKISWDWKNILDSFLEKQIAISPSDQYLFVFTKHEDEYMFDVFEEKENPNNKYLVISKV